MTWSAAALGDICDVVSGATPKTNEKRFWGGDIFWTTPKDISDLDSPYLDETSRTITEEGLKSCAASILPPNSVLLSSRAPIGLVAINKVAMATNQGYKSLVPKAEKIDSKFLYYWLKSKTAYLQGLGNGATFKEISKAVVERIEVPLPPLDEQRRIAAILDKANALRRKRKQATDLLATALDAFGELSISQSAGSNIQYLGGCLEFITTGGRNWSQYYADAGARFIRSLDVQMNRISNEDSVFVVAPDNAEARRTQTTAGDVLLTVTGSRIGRVAALPSELVGSYVSQHVAILRPKPDRLRPKFLSYYLSSRNGQRQIAKWQYGQTKPGLNFKQIESFEIPQVSVDEQVDIEDAIIRFENLMERQGLQEVELGFLFSSLQHRAFSGQL